MREGKFQKNACIALSLESNYFRVEQKHKKLQEEGAWVAQLVKCLPLAQVMISRSPCSEGSLLFPPLLPLSAAPAFSLSLK